MFDDKSFVRRHDEGLCIYDCRITKRADSALTVTFNALRVTPTVNFMLDELKRHFDDMVRIPFKPLTKTLPMTSPRRLVRALRTSPPDSATEDRRSHSRRP